MKICGEQYRVTRVAACAILLAQSCTFYSDAQSIEIGTTSAKWNPKIFSSVCDKVPFSPPDFRPLPKIVTRRPGLNLNSSCPESRQLKIVSPLTQTPEGKGAPMLCGIVYEGDEPIPFCTKG
jgi:hypothetical protein